MVSIRLAYLSLVLTGLCVIVPAGCLDQSKSPREKTVVKQLMNDVLERGLPERRQAIVRKFGSPTQSRETSVENPHLEDVQDTRYVLEYPGLTVQMYHAAYNDRQFFERVELTSEGGDPAGPLRFGVPRRKVRSVLGDPRERSEDRWSYGRQANQVHLEFREGRLYRVIWDFYVD